MELESFQLTDVIPVDTAQERVVDIPRDGSIDRLRIALTGAVDLAAGGGVAGSVLNDPILNPLGVLASMALVRNPESYAGSINFPPQLFFLMRYLLDGRKPAITPIADGNVATGKALYAEMEIPQSFFGALDTLLPATGLTSYKLRVKWQPGLSNIRDALLSGSSRTLTINATNPLRLEVQVKHGIGAGRPKPLAEIGWRYDSKVLDSAKIMTKPLSVTPGERVPFVMCLITANSVRADTTALDRIQFAYGRRKPTIDKRVEQLQRDNAADYNVRDGDWTTGLVFLDNLKQAGGNIFRVPEVIAEGGIPTINFDPGSLGLPTAPAQVDILSMVVRLTAEGRAQAAKLSGAA